MPAACCSCMPHSYSFDSMVRMVRIDSIEWRMVLRAAALAGGPPTVAAMSLALALLWMVCQHWGVANSQLHTNDLIPSTVVVGVDSIPGYTTYQLNAILGSSLKNCYTIAGAAGHPSSFPAALQVDSPFGTHVGGTNPAYWSYKAETEFDSWLTVGNTRGEQPSLGHIDIPFGEWSETQDLKFHNGAIFWMRPDAGPNGTVVRVTARGITNYLACIMLSRAF